MYLEILILLVLNLFLCNLTETPKNTDFGKYLYKTGKLQDLNRSNDDYEKMINTYAMDYLKNKSINEIFQEINKFNIFNYVSMHVPVNEELHCQMQHNNIDRLKVVDTRGLGDNDEIKRVIPFAGADAMMFN